MYGQIIHINEYYKHNSGIIYQSDINSYTFGCQNNLTIGTSYVYNHYFVK